MTDCANKRAAPGASAEDTRLCLDGSSDALAAKKSEARAGAPAVWARACWRLAAETDGSYNLLLCCFNRSN